MLPPERIPALVRSDGRFRDDMARLGAALAASAEARAQLRAEVAAQVEAFRATGLACDHLNAHKHFHLHPVIAAVAFRAARDAGIRAVRVPWEPPALVRAVDPAARTASRALWPFAALLRRSGRAARARGAGPRGGPRLERRLHRRPPRRAAAAPARGRHRNLPAPRDAGRLRRRRARLPPRRGTRRPARPPGARRLRRHRHAAATPRCSRA